MAFSRVGWLGLLALWVSGRHYTSAETLCSSQNTGSDSQAVFDTYQSRGACQQTCQGNAFAIVLDHQCWCSNVQPSQTTDTSECDDGCPGYGTDKCGNMDRGLFIYYQIGAPSATASSSTSSSSTSSSSSSSSTTPRTTSSTRRYSSSSSTSTSSTSTRTPSPSIRTVYLSASSSSTPPDTTSSRESSSSAVESTPTVRTVFITQSSSSATPESTSAGPTSSMTGSPNYVSPTQAAVSASPSKSETGGHNGFFQSDGKVAGTFVVVGLVILAILGLLGFLVYRRRKHDRQSRLIFPSSPDAGSNEKREDGGGRGGGAGALVSGLFGSKHERSASRTGLTSKQSQNSMRPQSHSSPASHHNQFDGDPYASALYIDQRVDPRSVMMRFDSNYSRTSLRDEDDYSRKVFRVMNPDEQTQSGQPPHSSSEQHR